MNFLKNAYGLPGAPMINFFSKNFQKCLSLSPPNPKICFVTPYIGKINSRQEGVNDANNLKKRKSKIVFNSGKETGTDAGHIIVTLYYIMRDMTYTDILQCFHSDKFCFICLTFSCGYFLSISRSP